MRRLAILLLALLAVSCTRRAEPPAPPEPPPPEEPVPEPTPTPSDQPWMATTWVPQEVEVGQEFEVRVALVNRSDEDQIFQTLHISEAYLAAVEILKTTPSREGRASHLGAGIREFPLGMRVSGRQHGGIVLSLRAVTEGEYNPDITVCVSQPRSEWVERYHAICVGHGDVPGDMETNWQPLAHGIRSTKIKAKAEGE